MKNSLFYTYIFLFCGFSLSAQTLNLMYYVSAIPGEHGMWVSRQKANETWFRGDKVLIDGVFDGNGVDPDIISQDDGSLRLYYFQGYFVTPPPQNPTPNSIYSAVSTDGIRFTGKRKVFEYNNVFDPSVVRLPNGSYVMGCTNMIGTTVNTVIATSPDGLSFTYKTTVENTGIPELMVLNDGSIRLFYNGPGGIVSSRSTDGGATWQKEQGVRLAYQQFVGDPSVSKVGNRLRMYVKGFNANGGQKLIGHKTQYAESTDNGNTFQMVKQLVLDSASVPEGVEMYASIKLETLSENDTLCTGEDAILDARIKTSPSFLNCTYEWFKNGEKLINGGQISGVNSNTLNIISCTLTDTGAYSLKVLSDDLSEGTLQHIFGPVRLTIYPKTEIIQDIDTSYMACYDETVTVSCKAVGKNIQYQWIESDGKPIIGENKHTISIQKRDNASFHKIRCIVYGACGQDTSHITTIQFISKSLISTDLPKNVELSLGNDTVLSISIDAEQYTYQWFRNDIAISKEIPALNSEILLNIVSMDSSDEGTYHAVIRNICDTLISQKVVLSIKKISSVQELSRFKIYPQPADNVIIIEGFDVEQGQATLFDIFGASKSDIKFAEGKAILSSKDIPSGMYMLRLISQSIPIIIIH
jgi:hypothetical protein